MSVAKGEVIAERTTRQYFVSYLFFHLALAYAQIFALSFSVSIIALLSFFRIQLQIGFIP